MPRSVIRNLCILLLSLGLVLSTYISERVSGVSQKQDNKYEKILNDENFRSDIENTEDAVDEITQTYHKTVNDLFNEYIAAMVKLGNSRKKEDQAAMERLLTPPAFKVNPETKLIEGREKCGGEGSERNLSTYCLADSAINEYFEFRAAMTAARVEARTQAIDVIATETVANNPQQKNLFGSLGDLVAGQKGIQGYGEVLSRIDREMEIGRQTLDQALAAYAELQMALPLHQKFKQTIKALEAYRDAIAKIRKEIDLYPVTFLDVTTTACT